MSSTSPMQNVKEWLPARFTLGGTDRSSEGPPFAVLVLNQPLENKALFRKSCQRANLVVAADGGANRIFDIGDDRELNCLNVICGDLDSIRLDVQKYFETKGVQIYRDADQYSTDMTKCLRYIREDSGLATESRDKAPGADSVHPMDYPDIAIFGGLGGRADQAFSQLHHLYADVNRHSTVSKGNLYLITPESIIFLLEKGLNKIHAPLDKGFFKENVGIIPVAKRSIITTRGLEWDVTDWPTEFGTQISTSNHIKVDTIEVETTERVLLTLELDAALADQQLES